MFLFVHLIYEAMLYIDTPRICSLKISDQFFIRGRILEWIMLKYVQ